MELSFEKSAAAARHARGATRVLFRSLHPDLVASAELVISELVTNVVRHTDDGGTARLRIVPGGIRLEVADRDSRPPVLGPPPTSVAQGGLGLRMVAELSSSWGVDAGPSGGKTVWAELRDPGH